MVDNAKGGEQKDECADLGGLDGMRLEPPLDKGWPDPWIPRGRVYIQGEIPPQVEGSSSSSIFRKENGSALTIRRETDFIDRELIRYNYCIFSEYITRV